MRKARSSATTPRASRAFCSGDVQCAAPVTIKSLQSRECPGDITSALAEAWRWYDQNWFVGTVVELKVAFFNHGFRFIGMDAPRARELLKNEPWIRSYVESVWRDRLIYDNVVTIWLDAEQVRPQTVRPEKCEYTDALGKEKLKYRSPWKAIELPTGLARRWSNVVEFDAEKGEHFRVLKRARVGDGFGLPTSYRVFRALNQCESMEVGDALLGYLSRTVIRQHKLGCDPKSAAFKSKIPHYYTQARADAVKATFGSTLGFVEAATNFDHAIEYPYPDPKLFAAEKWKGVLDRLVWWGGPLAFMILAPTSNPYLMPQFHQEAMAERPRVAAHLSEVLRSYAKLEVDCRWSSRCFLDPRTSAELLTAGLSAGPLSQTTFLESAGFDPDEEKERKKEEAADDPKLHLPIYDKDHGQEPGGLTSGGRPAGKTDPVG